MVHIFCSPSPSCPPHGPSIQTRTPAYLAQWLPEETSEFTASPSTQAWFQQEQNQGRPASSPGPCLSCGSCSPALASQHRVKEAGSRQERY